jgi:hypothetical protein
MPMMATVVKRAVDAVATHLLPFIFAPFLSSPAYRWQDYMP